MDGDSAQRRSVKGRECDRFSRRRARAIENERSPVPEQASRKRVPVSMGSSPTASLLHQRSRLNDSKWLSRSYRRAIASNRLRIFRCSLSRWECALSPMGISVVILGRFFRSRGKGPGFYRLAPGSAARNSMEPGHERK